MRSLVLATGMTMLALAAPAAAEQAGDAGKPLALYCNTVPALAVQRSDSVDNWVRICTVWFNANCNKLSAEEVGRLRPTAPVGTAPIPLAPPAPTAPAAPEAGPAR